MISQFSSIKNGCLDCTMLLVQLYTICVQLRQKNAPQVYEIIVENINYLWLLSIYYILVHKQNKCHVKNHLSI